MEKLILAFSDDCMQPLKDFYMSLSFEMTSFDLMEYVLLIEVIIYQKDIDAKDFVKVLEHLNAPHDKILKSSEN